MTSTWWFVIGWGSGMMTAICVAFVLVGVILSGEEEESERSFTPEHREKLEALRKAREEGRRIPLNLIPAVNVDLASAGFTGGKVETGKTEPPDFAVTGKPRRVPWHIRKRELEEAARSKRKKFESFQEYV